MSLRLDARLQRSIARLARQRGQSKSDFVRHVLMAAVASRAAAEAGGDLFERIAHLAGCVSSGRGDLSSRTGDKFRELLRQRRARR